MFSVFFFVWKLNPIAAPRNGLENKDIVYFMLLAVVIIIISRALNKIAFYRLLILQSSWSLFRLNFLWKFCFIFFNFALRSTTTSKKENNNPFAGVRLFFLLGFIFTLKNVIATQDIQLCIEIKSLLQLIRLKSLNSCSSLFCVDRKQSFIHILFHFFAHETSIQ